jgi:hypothetical protein
MVQDIKVSVYMSHRSCGKCKYNAGNSCNLTTVKNDKCKQMLIHVLRSLYVIEIVYFIESLYFKYFYTVLKVLLYCYVGY